MNAPENSSSCCREGYRNLKNSRRDNGLTQAEEERDNVYPWYDINNMTPSGLQKMDGRAGDLGKGPRQTRATAITENDEKKPGRGVEAVEVSSSVLMCFDVF